MPEPLDAEQPMTTTSPPHHGARDPTLRFLLSWQFGALILVLLLPAAILSYWPWELPKKEGLPFVCLLAAFGVSALFHLFIRSRRGFTRLLLALLATAAIFSVPLLWLVITRVPFSRMLLLGIFAVSLAVLPLPFAGPRLRVPAFFALGLAIAGAAALGVKKQYGASRSVAEQRIESFLSTHLANLSVISNLGRIPRPAVRGGGLTAFNGRILLATGDGYLYLLGSTREALSVEKLPYRVPLNSEEFAAAAGRHYREPARRSEYGVDGPPGVQTWRFRVADVLAQELDGRMRVFASHHYWKAAQKCFVIRVSALDVGRDGALPAAGGSGTWRTIFESSPCLPLTGRDAKQGKNPFQGEEIGGRLALLDDRSLLLTTGDLGFSGLESWQMFSQDPNASYGKTLRIRIDSGASEVFTLGHRNPQGLYIDAGGNIWLTEHGPRGGDELNLLHSGANYGWPLATYGTDYRSFVWPLNKQQGQQERYQEPIHAWIPSIGISNLIQVTGDLFPSWRGDFLIGSLSTRALYRMRVREGRVIFSEPIPIEQRVRDLIELSDGRILVWTDEAALLEIEPTSAMNGALLFGSLCQNCHWIHDGLSHRAGPDLFGIVDKSIASAPGFSYSPALKQLDGRWTARQLDRFLADPQGLAPGTSMSFAGMTDKAQRAEIIEYLRNTAK